MLIRGKSVVAFVAAALAIPTILLAPGCTDECVDRFDCRSSKGEGFICVDGKCVEGTINVPGPDAGEEDAGTEPDAGTEDAGTEDAGTEDAGTEDAGTEDGGTETDAGTEDAGMM